jgi:hypothetical protein
MAALGLAALPPFRIEEGKRDPEILGESLALLAVDRGRHLAERGQQGRFVGE